MRICSLLPLQKHTWELPKTPMVFVVSATGIRIANCFPSFNTKLTFALALQCSFQVKFQLSYLLLPTLLLRNIPYRSSRYLNPLLNDIILDKELETPQSLLDAAFYILALILRKVSNLKSTSKLISDSGSFNNQSLSWEDSQQGTQYPEEFFVYQN